MVLRYQDAWYMITLKENTNTVCKRFHLLKYLYQLNTVIFLQVSIKWNFFEIECLFIGFQMSIYIKNDIVLSVGIKWYPQM